MKFSSIFSSCLVFFGTTCAYNSTGPVTYLGALDPLWSAGASAQGLVFTGGVTGELNGSIVEGGIRNQTAQTLRNMAAIFEEAGTSWHHVLQVTIFVADVADVPEMNEVYRDMVPWPRPGRATVQVVNFVDDDFAIEVLAVAAVPYY